MTTAHGRRATYKGGAVNVDNWDVSLREIFGAAVSGHDIMEHGRLVNLTINGKKIGQIQLKDTLKENNDVKIVRKDPGRV